MGAAFSFDYRKKRGIYNMKTCLTGTIVGTVRPASDTGEAIIGLKQHIGICIR